MGTRTIIEFISEGFEAILCCDETLNLVREQADRIRDTANANNTRGGDGFDSDARLGRAYGSQRALGFVYTTDEKSRIAESEDKALSRAVM